MASRSSDSSLFSSLPSWKMPWSQWVLSYGTQAVVIGISLWVPVLHPEVLEGPKRDQLAIQLVPTPVPVNHEPQRRLPALALVARLDPPTEVLHLAAPKPQAKPSVEDMPVPAVKMATRKADPLPPLKDPSIPHDIVRTNVFSIGSSAPQTIERAAQQVQTGGFGDPNGLPAKPSENRQINIARAGGFDLPAGGGYGNGTDGSNGVRGVVASAGFGNGVAVADARATQGTVRQAGFGDADVPSPPMVQTHRSAPSNEKMVPAEIISKPVPAYTEEARTQRIEGEVLLEVVFEATGKLRVIRVVRGLGHGLDNSAIHAAEQIRFKPALRDGQPLDSTAVVHIIFQLA